MQKRRESVSDILVVDDDGLLRSLVVEWLAVAGYRVREAPNGDAALALLRARPAALVITDMQMPGTDGAQMLAALRSELPELRIVAMSGEFHSRHGVSTRAALALGASRCLVKPFGRKDLLDMVCQVIGAP